MEWLQTCYENFYRAFIEKDRYLAYIQGFRNTLELSFFAVILGAAIGLVVAVIKSSSERKKGILSKVLNFICNVYITIIRGTPVYVQILIIYYIIFSSRNSSPMLAGVVCFGINSSAYVAEIIRAGIAAVDRGQMEAGNSLGLSNAQTMVYIVLPQAIKNILPALGNEFIVLIKETSIVGAIAVTDVTKAAQGIGTFTYDLLTPLLIAAVMYLAVVLILTKLMSMLERRLARSDRH